MTQEDGSSLFVCVLVYARVRFRLFDVTMRVTRSDFLLSVSCMMMRRSLSFNQISSVEAGTFAGLGNLNEL